MAELRLGNIKPAGNDNIVVDSKYVKGGYVVVQDASELEALITNGETIIKGSLCYCQADEKFYQCELIIEQQGNKEVTVKKWTDVGFDGLAEKLNTEIARAKCAETKLEDTIKSEGARIDEDLLSIREEMEKEVSKLNTLIGGGEDEDKSVRTIANEELAAQLLSGQADADFKTLQQLAAWLEEHPESVAEINQEIEELDKNLGKEISRAKNTENALNDKLNGEISLREAQINGLNFSLKEEVNRSKNAEDTFNSAITLNAENIAKEEKRAKGIENSLRSALNEEIQLREAQINGLNFLLKEEVNRAKQVEQSISDSLNNYENIIGFVQAGEKTLVETFNETLETETNRAIKTEEQIQQKLQSEIQLREAQINGLNFSLKEEVNRAKEAEKELSEKLIAEESRASSAEYSLNNKINEEIQLREAQVNGLNFSLKEEVNRAKETDKSLDERITTENSRALAAETELREYIDKQTTVISEDYILTLFK